MKRLFLACAAAAMLSLPVSARPYSLVALMETIQNRYPQASITARFNDWRTVSRYRSHAGLHLGYDIALPGGAAVPAAWGGRVVAVTPWWGPQYGITVDSGGVETTYGHLAPLVTVGQIVLTGETVGRTVIDHVDVKMRDTRGAYVDFGDGFCANSLTPAMTREARLVAYRDALNRERTAEAEAGRWSARVDELVKRQSQLSQLGDKLARWEGLYRDGAISKNQLAQVQQASEQALGLPERLSAARQNRQVSQTMVQQARQERERLGRDLAVPGVKGVSEAPPAVASVARPVNPELERLVDDGVITRVEADRLAQQRQWATGGPGAAAEKAR